jgi:hypothetical protein
MATARIYFKDERAGEKFTRSMKGLSEDSKQAMECTLHMAAQEIVARAKEDIKGAGNFGSRWTDGFSAEVSRGGGNYRLDISHDVPYFNVFERGALIQGNPMLWIPLSFASDAQGFRARDYPGSLFRVDRVSGGAPLLLDYDTKEPKYFGKESVTIPKKFHIGEIISDVARKLRDYYRSCLGK